MLLPLLHATGCAEAQQGRPARRWGVVGALGLLLEGGGPCSEEGPLEAALCVFGLISRNHGSTSCLGAASCAEAGGGATGPGTACQAASPGSWALPCLSTCLSADGEAPLISGRCGCRRSIAVEKETRLRTP